MPMKDPLGTYSNQEAVHKISREDFKVKLKGIRFKFSLKISNLWMKVLIIIVLGILSLSYFILISSKPAIWSTLCKLIYETQNVIPI